MTFGEQIFGDDVRLMIEYFLSNGYDELDTAYVYNKGECEALIGKAIPQLADCDIKVSTKVNPRITGKLDRKAVLSQFNESLRRLNIEKIHTLYLHFPDPTTPIVDTLEACAQLYNEGKFEQLGLSNFASWQVSEIYHVCEHNGWMLPRVYEGVYNPLSRHAERELNEALNHYNISFYAYNPLAGGMLTNKYSSSDREVKAGRFLNRPNYQDRYWKNSFFLATDNLKRVCAKHNINIVEATYRWLAFHSMLNGMRGDSIIIGASRLEQLKQNMNTISEGELPGDIVEAYQEAWLTCQADAPEYFRSYQPKK